MEYCKGTSVAVGNDMFECLECLDYDAAGHELDRPDLDPTAYSFRWPG